MLTFAERKRALRTLLEPLPGATVESYAEMMLLLIDGTVLGDYVVELFKEARGKFVSNDNQQEGLPW